jgi:putative peptidoglycan lipid II flippase
MTHASTSARLLAAGALAALLVALGWAVANGLQEDEAAAPVPRAQETVVTTTRPKPKSPAAAQGRFVKLAAAGAFDPEGDGHERDEEASLAVDGNRATFWRTERYSRFFKTGVGLILDAGRRVRVRQVVVDSATPGVRAEIRLGSSRTGPFTRVSAAKTLAARTTFPVAGRSGRYVVVWVTGLPPESAGEVAEVRVRAT